MERTVEAILKAYRRGVATPRALIDTILREIESDSGKDAIFILQLSREELEPYLAQLEGADPASLPLYGVPFVIKDNIDLAGVPTTAACPAYAYTPDESAFVVELLIRAGAVPLGKVNLDQFATGLVGVRSPYGIPTNPLNPEYIPGGSSCGSAVAVAKGYAAFSLGTDTAGSGRVPAAFNELIGLKPSRGALSNRGLVPACRSLDCISIFARTIQDARAVFEVVSLFDHKDDYARPYTGGNWSMPNHKTVGVPRREQLNFFGNGSYEALFDAYVGYLSRLPSITVREIDFSVFLKTAALLYEGSWVAERYAAVGDFMIKNPGAAHPVTEGIIGKARNLDARTVFENLYLLQHYKRLSEAVWDEVDFIITPTTGTHYRVAEVLKDPVQTNSNLGYYTNFMNLLDLSAIAIPAGRTVDGLPFGVTFCAPCQRDHLLMELAASVRGEEYPPAGVKEDRMDLAVCGAHMEGLALNDQLRSLGGRFVRSVKSAPRYRMFCLHHKSPIRPGLVRCADAQTGPALDMEIWSLPIGNIGRFLASIQEPLGLGSVECEDGTWVHGFVCDATAAHLPDSEDITHFGGWRAYLAQNPPKR